MFGIFFLWGVFFFVWGVFLFFWGEVLGGVELIFFQCCFCLRVFLWVLLGDVLRFSQNSFWMCLVSLAALFFLLMWSVGCILGGLELRYFQHFVLCFYSFFCLEFCLGSFFWMLVRVIWMFFGAFFGECLRIVLIFGSFSCTV